ncbi:hypothetical protein CJF32_00001788 [Rutstroemia sp. NJR-2017a WRK4]|nr:hypothetical protein CJF32_00001788 [Rutstroemia sp. NJR-2017a WRK4]
MVKFVYGTYTLLTQSSHVLQYYLMVTEILYLQLYVTASRCSFLSCRKLCAFHNNGRYLLSGGVDHVINFQKGERITYSNTSSGLYQNSRMRTQGQKSPFASNIPTSRHLKFIPMQ